MARKLFLISEVNVKFFNMCTFTLMLRGCGEITSSSCVLGFLSIPLQWRAYVVPALGSHVWENRSGIVCPSCCGPLCQCLWRAVLLTWFLVTGGYSGARSQDWLLPGRYSFFVRWSVHTEADRVPSGSPTAQQNVWPGTWWHNSHNPTDPDTSVKIRKIRRKKYTSDFWQLKFFHLFPKSY